MLLLIKLNLFYKNKLSLKKLHWFYFKTADLKLTSIVQYTTIVLYYNSTIQGV